MLPKEMYFKLTAPFYMIFQDECKIYNVMGIKSKKEGTICKNSNAKHFSPILDKFQAFSLKMKLENQSKERYL